MGNLGVIYLLEEKYEEATALFEDAIQRLQDCEQLDTSSGYVLLANHAKALTQGDQAERGLQQIDRALDICTRVLEYSEDHYAVHVLRGTRARCLAALGRETEALEAATDCARQLERILGEHQYTRSAKELHTQLLEKAER